MVQNYMEPIIFLCIVSFLFLLIVFFGFLVGRHCYCSDCNDKEYSIKSTGVVTCFSFCGLQLS